MFATAAHCAGELEFFTLHVFFEYSRVRLTADVHSAATALLTIRHRAALFKWVQVFETCIVCIIQPHRAGSFIQGLTFSTSLDGGSRWAVSCIVTVCSSILLTHYHDASACHFMRERVTLLAAPPHTAVPFECSNGTLRLNISPLPPDQPPQSFDPIDIDLASIGMILSATITHYAE